GLEPRVRAAREHRDLLRDVVAREEEGAEVGAQAGDVVRLRDALELLEDAARGIEHLELVLRIEGDLDAMAEHALTGVGAEHPRRDAQERRLAGAVRPDERDALGAGHEEVDPRVDAPLAVALVDAAQAQHLVARARRLGEAQADARARGGGDLDARGALERPDPALHHARLARLVAKALDQPLGARAFAVLLRARGLELLAPALPLGEGVIEA